MLDLFEESSAPFAYESQARRCGFTWIAGVDEAGRGALAGPVVAAAVIFDEPCIELQQRVTDSKLLPEPVREDLFPLILHDARAVGVGIVASSTIDRINILQASLQAMAEAVCRLSLPPDLCLIDGRDKIPILGVQRTIIGGDLRIFSIAAASIVAKVTRDRLMREMDVRFPNYGFSKHKGYGTPEHRNALLRVGPCEIHRRSFRLEGLE